MIHWPRRADRFPMSCNEIGIGWSRRSAWHVWIKCMSPRDDKSAPWAYGTIGVHEFPSGAEDDLIPALHRAISAVLRKARQARVELATDTVVYCLDLDPQVRSAAESAAARLGMPFARTSRH